MFSFSPFPLFQRNHPPNAPFSSHTRYPPYFSLQFHFQVFQPIGAKQSKERKKKSHSRNRPRAPGDRLLAALAIPDAHAVPLHRRFAAKGAGVAGVLGDFHLFDLFAEGGAVSVWGGLVLVG